MHEPKKVSTIELRINLVKTIKKFLEENHAELAFDDWSYMVRQNEQFSNIYSNDGMKNILADLVDCLYSDEEVNDNEI